MKHLILTVHGIRTYGAWSERLGVLVREVEPDAEIVNYSYGYFSFAAFVFPPTRWLATRRCKQIIREQVQRENWDRVDIVAHSFGTHLTCWALRSLSRKQQIGVHTLILAGSVLRSRFRWDQLIPKFVDRLSNECGASDGALIASQLFVPFTGMAGRTGFSGALSSRFRNRYFDFGHSGYFDGDLFMRRYWVPLLTSDIGIEPVDQRPPLTVFRGMLNTALNNAEPVKLSVYFGFLVGSMLWLAALLLQSEVARDLLAKEVVRANRLLGLSREQLAAALVGIGRSRLDTRPHEAVRYAEAAATISNDLPPALLLRDAILHYPLYAQLAPENASSDAVFFLQPAPAPTDIFAIDPGASNILSIKRIESDPNLGSRTLVVRDIASGKEKSSTSLPVDEEVMAPTPSASELIFVRKGNRRRFHLKVLDLGSGNIERPCGEFEDVVAAASTDGHWPIYVLRAGGDLFEVRNSACNQNQLVERGNFPNAFDISVHPSGTAVAVLEIERVTIFPEHGPPDLRLTMDAARPPGRRNRAIELEAKEYELFWGPRADTVLLHRGGVSSRRLLVPRPQGSPTQIWSATGWRTTFTAGPTRARNGERFLVPDRVSEEGRAAVKVLDLSWPETRDGPVEMTSYDLAGAIPGTSRLDPKAIAVRKDGEVAVVAYAVTGEDGTQIGSSQIELWALAALDTSTTAQPTSIELQSSGRPVVRMAISKDGGTLVVWDVDQVSNVFRIDGEIQRTVIDPAWIKMPRTEVPGGEPNLFARASQMLAPDLDDATVRAIKAEQSQTIPQLGKWELIRSRLQHFFRTGR